MPGYALPAGHLVRSPKAASPSRQAGDVPPETFARRPGGSLPGFLFSLQTVDLQAVGPQTVYFQTAGSETAGSTQTPGQTGRRETG